jgi:hydrogenase maturation protease
MKNKKHDLLVGVGNILLTDDGIGVHIIRHMEEKDPFGNAEYLDMGTSSMDLGYYIDDNIRKMVIVDSIKADEKPGTLFRMAPGDLVSKRDQSYSLHQLKLVDTLKLATIDTEFPETIIIGIVPHDVSTVSENLSSEMKKIFPEVYGRVVKAIKGFLEQ